MDTDIEGKKLALYKLAELVEDHHLSIVDGDRLTGIVIEIGGDQVPIYDMEVLDKSSKSYSTLAKQIRDTADSLIDQKAAEVKLVVQGYYLVHRGITMFPMPAVVFIPFEADMGNLRELIAETKPVSAGKFEITDGKVLCREIEELDINPQAEDVDLIRAQSKGLKYIRTYGFNGDNEPLIFAFTEEAFHNRTAKMMTRGLHRRCRYAGFVEVNQQGRMDDIFELRNIDSLRLCGESETLGVCSMDAEIAEIEEEFTDTELFKMLFYKEKEE